MKKALLLSMVLFSLNSFAEQTPQSIVCSDGDYVFKVSDINLYETVPLQSKYVVSLKGVTLKEGTVFIESEGYSDFLQTYVWLFKSSIGEDGLGVAILPEDYKAGEAQKGSVQGRADLMVHLDANSFWGASSVPCILNY